MNEQITKDAQEFGAHIKQGGWRLGLLVARSAKKGVHQKPGHPDFSEKVNIKTFAATAGVTAERASAHYDAWEKAAKDGIVTASADLSPGEDPEIDWDSLPDWKVYYVPVSGGSNGGKGRNATKQYAKTVLEQLTPEDQASVAAGAIDTPEVTDALKADPEATEHVWNAAMNTSEFGKGEKVKTPPKNKSMQQMSITLRVLAVLEELIEAAKDDPQAPLIVECKNLMRSALDTLDGIQAANDPEQIDQMFGDLEDWLAAQK